MISFESHRTMARGWAGKLPSTPQCVSALHNQASPRNNGYDRNLSSCWNSLQMFGYFLTSRCIALGLFSWFNLFKKVNFCYVYQLSYWTSLYYGYTFQVVIKLGNFSDDTKLLNDTIMTNGEFWSLNIILTESKSKHIFWSG